MNWRRAQGQAVGIVGCGAIGAQLARYIDTQCAGALCVKGLTDLNAEAARALAAQLRSRPAVLPLTHLIQRVQLVIEAAAASVAFHIAQQALEKGKDIMVMSVGGLLGRQEQLYELGRAHGGHLLIPSGAVAGLDALKAMAIDGVRRVTLTSRKPPHSFAGAPFVRERQLHLEALQHATTIFEGSAHEAVIGFPQNANVAATLALCAGRAEAVSVRLIADPAVMRNSHEVEVEGVWGTMTSRSESQPAEGNARTSASAIASAQALLKMLIEPNRIGT